MLSSEEETWLRQLHISSTHAIAKTLDVSTCLSSQPLFRLEQLWSNRNASSSSSSSDLRRKSSSSSSSSDTDFVPHVFQQCKHDLSCTEHQLDTIDGKAWGKHTDETNALRDLPFELRKRRVEMATIAWTKMWELLCTFPLLPAAPFWKRPMTTWHLCEAPGAFISATNHYVHTRCPPSVSWDWRAVSLHPHYEGNSLESMLDDDRVILETWKHWSFGVEGSGDIRSVHNILSFWKQAQDEQRCIPLVTGDGSISCENTPDQQEQVTAHLHYCEWVTACGLVSPGGNMVLKLFTCFETCTHHLLYLSCALFARVHLCKPFTSKAGNKETYLVCVQRIDDDVYARTYGHTFQELLARLLQGVTRFETHSLFPPLHLPSSFVRKMELAAQLFSGCSRAIIQRNLDWWHRLQDRPHEWSAFQSYCKQQKSKAAREWLRVFPIVPLPSTEMRLVPHANIDGSTGQRGIAQQQARDTIQGSFSSRIQNPSSSSSSSEVPSLHSTVDSASLALRWMLRMGYQPGKGLGKHLQGRVEPVEAYTGTQSTRGLTERTYDWFSSTHLYPFVWNVRWGRAPEHITLSKFVSQQTLVQVQRMRRLCTPPSPCLKCVTSYPSAMQDVLEEAQHVLDLRCGVSCLPLALSLSSSSSSSSSSDVLRTFSSSSLHPMESFAGTACDTWTTIHYFTHLLHGCRLSKTHRVVSPVWIESWESLSQSVSRYHWHVQNGFSCWPEEEEEEEEIRNTTEQDTLSLAQRIACCGSFWPLTLTSHLPLQEVVTTSLRWSASLLQSTSPSVRFVLHLELVYAVLMSLLCLADGGSLCVPIHDAWDRVTVGMIRMLTTWFSSVTIVSDTHNDAWLVALGFQRKPVEQEVLLDHLGRLMHQMLFQWTMHLLTRAPLLSVLEILPMNSCLVPVSFWKQILAKNEELAQHILSENKNT